MNIETPRAVVRSPVAPLFDEPRVASVQISQLLAGHPVKLLEERDGWCCVQGADRYEGWMHRGYLHSTGDASSQEPSGPGSPSSAAPSARRISRSSSTRRAVRCTITMRGAWPRTRYFTQT